MAMHVATDWGSKSVVVIYEYAVVASSHVAALRHDGEAAAEKNRPAPSVSSVAARSVPAAATDI
jgi:hypothetical protein